MAALHSSTLIKITRLAAAGMSDREIAAETGSTMQAVCKVRTRHGIPAARGRHGEVLPRPDVQAAAAALATIAPPRAMLTYDEEKKALCAQTDPEAFYPEQGGSTLAAKKVCSECPLGPKGTGRCLEVAMLNGEVYGVWGGLSEQERKALRAGRPLPKSKEKRKIQRIHGTEGGFRQHTLLDEEVCQPCADAHERWRATTRESGRKANEMRWAHHRERKAVSA